MKCTIPEISWHNREPVLSVDLHPISCDHYKLASGGGDTHVLIWQLILNENGAVQQEVVSDLTRHQRAVNCVRWSPNGQYLASADDDGNILIWHLKNDNIPLLEGDTGDKEIWLVHKVLRGHKEDVYDLSWSPDSSKIFSGSVDNTAILWDIEKGRMENILRDHKGFVQGVTWDPENQILATISTDRICRLFDVSGKQVKARIFKGKLPVQANHFLHDKEVKYFHDDTFRSFFRRLQFSPDGSLLVVPSGHAEADDCKKILNATLIFLLDNLAEPVALLPISKQSSTVIRFCPVLFQHHEDGPEPVFKLPYRMILAVGTDHDVILYDTQQLVPFARFQDIHYTRLTDLTWSHDGRLLTASSTDGFCSLITFEPNELGEVYVEEECEVEDSVMDISVNEEIENENVDNNIQIEKEEKKCSFLKKWSLSGPTQAEKTKDKSSLTGVRSQKEPEPKSARKKLTLLDSFCESGKKTEVNVSDDECIIISPKKVIEDNQTENKVSKKRVPFITLSSPGKKKMKLEKKLNFCDTGTTKNADCASTKDDAKKSDSVENVVCNKVNDVDVKDKDRSKCTNEAHPIQPVVKKRATLITLSPCKKQKPKTDEKVENTKGYTAVDSNKSVDGCNQIKIKKRATLVTISNSCSKNKNEEQEKTEITANFKREVTQKRVPLITLSTATTEKKNVPDEDDEYTEERIKQKCMQNILSVKLTKDRSIKSENTDLKRKRSFLERWALSPPKKKVEVIKVKEDNDVIEILDD